MQPQTRKKVTVGIILVVFMAMMGLTNLKFARASDLGVEDIDFDVEAGNGRATKLGNNYFEITMQKDESGAEVWFGFNVTQHALGNTIKFRSIQDDNLWSGTWCYPVYSEDHGTTWKEADDISIPDEGGDGRVLYFNVTPKTDNFMCYAGFPIIYSDYEDWIDTISVENNCTVTSDTVSGDEELYLITVTDSGGSAGRPTLWFIAGQDPPETWPQHAAMGMVNFLLSDDQDANRLKEKFIWKIVAVSNPNAVRQGLTEINVNNSGGEEINVDWPSPSEPETTAMKGDIQDYVDGGGEVVIILDLHSAGGAMDPQGCGIFYPNDEPNATFAQMWVDDVVAGTVYDDNDDAGKNTPSNQAGGVRLRSYADTLGISGATLELFQCQNLFDWGDAPDPVNISDLHDVGEDLAKSLEDYADQWSGEGEEPEPPPLGEGNATYTEMIDSFNIGTPDAWTDYDITTNNGVPVNTTAEIVMSNTYITHGLLMGVRTDGSSLRRYINASAPDTVGGQNVRMLVNVSSEGIIECYADDEAYIDFYITGYWSNVTFRETDHHLLVTSEEDGSTAWTDKNMNTIYGIPVNSTIAVICCSNRTTGLRECGVRTDGSSEARELDMERTKGDGSTSTYDTYVQSSQSGIIEVSCEYYTHNWLYISGYFGYMLNFTEDWDTEGISAASWTDDDLTAVIGADEDVVDFSLCNIYTTDSASSHGVREDDTAISRVVPQAESIGGGPHGFGMSANTDGTGVVELYSSANNEYFKYGGYFTIKPVYGEQEEPSGDFNVNTVQSPFGNINGVPDADISKVNEVLAP